MRLLHFADLHLGVENYGRLDPATGLPSRLLDFRRSLAFIVDVALGEEVAAVLFAGDLYRTASPTPTWQREFAVQLRRLQQGRIPVVLVVGNHDTPAAHGRATSVDVFSALELEGTHVFRTPRLVLLPTRSGPIQIAGLPWPTRHHLRTQEAYCDLTQDEVAQAIARLAVGQVRDLASRLDPRVPSALVAHVAASGAYLSGSERTALIGTDPVVHISDLADPAFDYVALGHVHRYQDLNPGGRPPVVYSGSPERVDFGEQDEAKGCCLVDLEPGRGRPSVRFIPTPARRFVTVDVDARGHTDPTPVVLAAVERTDVKGAIVRVRYCADVPGAVQTERVRRALGEAHAIASIAPVVVPRERQRRASVPHDARPPVALDRFIDNRPDLHAHRDALRERARALEAELAREEAEGGLP